MDPIMYLIFAVVTVLVGLHAVLTIAVSKREEPTRVTYDAVEAYSYDHPSFKAR